MMGRAVLKRLKETTLNSFFDIATDWGLKSGGFFTYNNVAGIITFYNGSEIILKDLYSNPSDPNFDSLGSLEITGAFIDECAEVSERAKSIVSSRIRYKLKQYDLIPKLLMTCNPWKGWGYRDFYKTPRADHRAFISARVEDNDFVSEHYKISLKRLVGLDRLRLLEGKWEYELDGALILYDSILDMWTNELPSGKGYITADIARYGRDSTVIVRWEGLNVVQILELGKCSVVEAADTIRQMKRDHNIGMSRIIIDEMGVGGGVVDMLQGCKGYVANSPPLPESGEKRNYRWIKDQCSFKLADMINNAEIGIRVDTAKQRIIDELETIKQDKIEYDGKKQVEGKDKQKESLGRSPDIADCFVMRMYWELSGSHFHEAYLNRIK